MECNEQRIEHTNRLQPINKEAIIEEIMHANKRYLEIGKIVNDLLDDGAIMIDALKQEDKRALHIYTKNKDREKCEKYSLVHIQ